MPFRKITNTATRTLHLPIRILFGVLLHRIKNGLHFITAPEGWFSVKKNTLFSRITDWWRTLHLVDRLLLVFMIILLTKSAHNLFFHELTMHNSDTLCAVIRTIAASIFGYFISAGFRGASRQSTASAQATGIGFAADQHESGPPTAQIGFSAEAETNSRVQTRIAVGRSNEFSDQRLRQQMIIVAIIGISSLLMLVAACNDTQTSPEAVATLSQLCDFVSGSVGFLIGHAGTAQNLS